MGTVEGVRVVERWVIDGWESDCSAPELALLPALLRERGGT